MTAETSGERRRRDNGLLYRFLRCYLVVSTRRSNSPPIGAAVVFTFADGYRVPHALPYQRPDPGTGPSPAGACSSVSAFESSSRGADAHQAAAVDQAEDLPPVGGVTPRTQRRHWMQRLPSLYSFGMDASTPRFGQRYESAGQAWHSGTPAPAARSCRYFRTRGTCGYPPRTASLMIALRMSSSSSVLFSITMPFATGVVHAAMFLPPTRTVQMRQAPAGFIPS